jgi:peptide/nickel transport system substrate-binding protein
MDNTQIIHRTFLYHQHIKVFFVLFAGLFASGCGGEDAAVPRDVAPRIRQESTASTGGDIPRSSWPESWFKAPRKASELGLQTFQQSPILDAQVASGELPPVAERLPDDPIVVEGIDGIGQYGGTAALFHAGEQLLNVPEGPLRVGPQLSLTLPNFAEGVEYTNGGRTLTIALSPGHRWSDGHAITSADFAFWFENVLMDKRLTPVVERRFKGARMEVHDPYLFSYHFPEPQPLFVKFLAHSGWRISVPAHFMRRYHPDFTPVEQLEEEAEELGLQDWRTYFQAADNVRDLMVFDRPVKTAYVIISRTSTRSRFRRNPFYPKVDREGNQLPYIDALEVQRVDSAEIMAAKASTGQVVIAGRQFTTADIPLFKRFEKDNGYSTYLWPRPYGSDVAIMINMTHDDERKRRIYQDVRFRRALSLAINRDEINDIAYYGKGVPRQLTVVPASRYFEPEFATAWAEYDPQQAGALLDAMGLIDRDGDGRREGSDGQPLDITFEYSIGETPKEITVELVTAHWREVGLHIGVKQISGSLKSIRASGGVMDMSLWHADRNADILFPIEPFWYVPMHIGQEVNHWAEWSRWYRSDGVRGWEPPPEVKQLIAWWEVLRRTQDIEERVRMGKNILRSQAENVWAIGIIGLGPHPVIVRDDLKNVPRQGYWGWDSRWSWPYYPETWYLSQD